MRLLPGLAALFLIGTATAALSDFVWPRASAGTIEQPAWEEGPPDPAPNLLEKISTRRVADASRVELRAAVGVLLLAYPAQAGKAVPVEAVRERDAVKEAAVARWAGDRARAAAAVARAAAIDPTDPLARFEQTRQGKVDPELWTYLAADPERVLDVADAYLTWGFARDAAVVLGYRYPPVPRSRMMPQDYALVAYYRGFVHQKLDQYADEDFRLASTLPLTGVFPHRPSTRAVLEAALAANPADASARRLMELWLAYTEKRAPAATLPAARAPTPTAIASPPPARPAAAPATPEAGAREQYFAALAEAGSGDAKSALRRWEAVAKMRAELDSRDYVYPLLAQAALGRPVDAVSPYLNVRRALESASGDRRAILLYNQSLLLALQGRMAEAEAVDSNPDLTRLRLPR